MNIKESCKKSDSIMWPSFVSELVLACLRLRELKNPNEQMFICYKLEISS